MQTKQDIYLEDNTLNGLTLRQIDEYYTDYNDIWYDLEFNRLDFQKKCDQYWEELKKLKKSNDSKGFKGRA